MEFIRTEEIDRLNSKEIDSIYEEHYNPALAAIFKAAGMDNYFTSAEGMYMYDSHGKKYIDFIGGFGSMCLGHNPKEVQQAVVDAFCRPNFVNISKSTYTAVLANDISYLTDGKLKYCLFANCGTEAVEEALKLALLYNTGGTIIYCSGGYHGKTLGSISALGTKEKNNYEPFLMPFIEVPFGDIEAMEKAIRKNDVAGILIEPVQGEGGVIIPPEGYFKKLRNICDDDDIVLILDEIQTGLGRCGTMFRYEQLEIVPDIMCLAKPLSGGVMPIGCICVKGDLWDKTYRKLRYGDTLTTTFGGNTLACAAAIKTLSLIKDMKLPERSAELGAYAKAALLELKRKHRLIKDVRGIGLMIGIEFDFEPGIIPEVMKKIMISTIISDLLKEYGIITVMTSNYPSVLRMQPPLIVEKEQIDYFVDSLDKVMERYGSITQLAVNSLKEIGKNIL